LKKDIRLIEGALGKVMSIRGITFARTDDEKNIRYAGVIAQELEKVFPEVVIHNIDNDTKSVAYGNITALLIEAIKEQQKRINRLEEINGIDNNSSEKS
jgi:hypothetical protein